MQKRRWTDAEGYIHWIEPDGKTDCKKPHGKQTASAIRGHTLLKGSVWENNFEDIFAAVDNDAPRLISQIESLPRSAHGPTTIAALCSGDRETQTAFHTVDTSLKDRTLRFALSVLLRCPRYRYQRTQFPAELGFPPSENAAKAHMERGFNDVNRHIAAGRGAPAFIAVLHAPEGSFLFGDGLFEDVTSAITLGGFEGVSLFPLTPSICLFISLRSDQPQEKSWASLNVAPDVIDEVNALTQAYSKGILFFRGTPPVLRPDFSRNEHRRIARPWPVVEALKALAKS